jgi:hypothetical protein
MIEKTTKTVATITYVIIILIVIGGIILFVAGPPTP